MSFWEDRSKYCRKDREQDSKKHRNQQFDPGNAMCHNSDLVVAELSAKHSISGGYFFLGNKKKKNLVLPQTGPKAFKIFHKPPVSYKKSTKCHVPSKVLRVFSYVYCKTRYLPSSLTFSLHLQTLSDLEIHKSCRPCPPSGPPFRPRGWNIRNDFLFLTKGMESRI